MNDLTLYTTHIYGNTYELRKDNLIYCKGQLIPHVKVREDNDKLLLFPASGGKPITVDRALFMLFIADRFALPHNLWDKVTPIFLDGDVSNFELGNLYVHYNEQIEHDSYKGYYYIPGYEYNVINESGIVIDLVTHKLCVPKVSEETKKNNSYVSVNVRLQRHKKKSRMLHRFLGLVFKNPPKDYPNKVVGHVNAIKYDFSLDNLEWVTYGENNDRARLLGLRTDNTQVECMDTETNKVTLHNSRNECANYIGCSNGIVSSAFTSGNRVVFKRYKLRNLGEDLNWDDIKVITKQTGESTPIKARNVFTGGVLEFPSIKRAIKHFEGLGQKLHLVTAIRQINGEAEKYITCGHEFKKLEDDTPWTEFTKWDKEVYNRGLNVKTAVYEMVEVTTGKKEIHFGWKPIADLLTLCKRTVVMAGVNGSLLRGKYKLNKLR